VVKHVYAAAADAVLVANHLPKLGAHLVTAQSRTKKKPGGRNHAGEKKGGGVAAAVYDKQFGSFTEEKSRHTELCVQLKVNPRGDILSTKRNRLPQLRGGADAGSDNCYAACACDTKFLPPRRACGT
jgi:hypothetical protein